jgi:hypothetical protein
LLTSTRYQTSVLEASRGGSGTIGGHAMLKTSCLSRRCLRDLATALTAQLPRRWRWRARTKRWVVFWRWAYTRATLTKTPQWCARIIPRPRSFTNWLARPTKRRMRQAGTSSCAQLATAPSRRGDGAESRLRSSPDPAANAPSSVPSADAELAKRCQRHRSPLLPEPCAPRPGYAAASAALQL